MWGEGQANDQSLLFNINANSKGLGCQGPADVQKAGGRGQDRAADRAASALSERPQAALVTAPPPRYDRVRGENGPVQAPI